MTTPNVSPPDRHNYIIHCFGQGGKLLEMLEIEADGMESLMRKADVSLDAPLVRKIVIEVMPLRGHA